MITPSNSNINKYKTTMANDTAIKVFNRETIQKPIVASEKNNVKTANA